MNNWKRKRKRLSLLRRLRPLIVANASYFEQKVFCSVFALRLMPQRFSPLRTCVDYGAVPKLSKLPVLTLLLCLKFFLPFCFLPFGGLSKVDRKQAKSIHLGCWLIRLQARQQFSECPIRHDRAFLC